MPVQAAQNWLALPVFPAMEQTIQAVGPIYDPKLHSILQQLIHSVI
jgi:hypothetical protein